MIVGYARVSTDGQTPDAPYAALAAAEKVFAEKTSEARCCAKARAGFRSLADAWADTTTPHWLLMLTVLSGLAEFERELIRSRTDE